MNRRELLAASAASTLLGTGGCIANLDPRDEKSTDPDDENTTDENTVPGCTSKAEWTGDITSGPADPDPDSIAGHRDCANADRPEPTGNVCETFELEKQNGEIDEFRSVGVEPYPEPPNTFDEEPLTEYVYEYEDAYQQNKAVSEYGERAYGAGAEILDDWGDPTRRLDIYDQITVVGIRFAPPVSYVTRDGNFVGDDNLSEQAVYGVDETGIVRIEEPYLDNDEKIVESPPNPVEDGDLLECF